METLLTVIHIVTAVFMVATILLQGGNSGGVSAAFGGGNSSGFFGATGATSFLGKLTYAMAAVFMLTSIGLTVYKSADSKTGLKDRLLQEESQKQPASDPAALPSVTPSAGL